MAADWIKMRSDLQTHPKIVRILSATRSDKFRVVGGLHAVWAVFDTHSVDGVLEGYTPETMDHVIGWEGFSEAMIAVGWLAFDGDESLSMPEFEAHNGQSAKRRAEDQKRKKQSRSSPQPVRNLSADDEDNKRTREEKRREEKKEQKNSRLDFGDCSEEVIADFKKLRKAKKAELTQTALTGIKREASKAGMSLQSALETCCLRGWTGFKAEWVSGNGDEPKPKARRAL